MVEIDHISKKFRRGAEEFVALRDVSFRINKGDCISVSGPSGSGKSTLLNIIGGLIRPDAGQLNYKGTSIYDQGGKYRAVFRKKEVGFMFQQFHLMPYLTLLENIKLSCYQPSDCDGISSYLEACSLQPLKNKYPSELSVGEKQRAAFIRAIISSPEMLLADEPTGNLDPRNSEIIMSLMEQFHRNGGTVVLVSHDPASASFSNLSLQLASGRISTVS